MDNIYTYIVSLPPGVNEVVMPCSDGYTVYLSDRLDRNGRMQKYSHAVGHIENGDFEQTNVQEIESWQR